MQRREFLKAALAGTLAVVLPAMPKQLVGGVWCGECRGVPCRDPENHNACGPWPQKLTYASLPSFRNQYADLGGSFSTEGLRNLRAVIEASLRPG